jgi:S-adenosylmethionine:tRNA ribosyltransferase-isomerase
MLSDLKNIRIDEYNYPLPDERIARYPLAERDHSKLLCLKDGVLAEHRFYDLPSLLPQGALLVFNDTKVIHARLLFRKETGATIEIFCLEPHNMAVSEAFEQREQCSWVCFIGNNKKWKDGVMSGRWQAASGEFELSARRREAVGNAWVVDFSWTGGASFAEVIENAGVIPLPPYLGRDAEESDATRYQTVYAHYEGSVAAPTAGLHFTEHVLAQIDARHIERNEITLHVGAGTFKPVKTESIEDHEMHSEYIFVPWQTIDALMRHNGECTCVGTTSVRTIESLYYIGLNIINKTERRWCN